MSSTPRASSAHFLEWRGFEKKPLGLLLKVKIDQSGDMGIAYERSCDFLKERHSHDRWQITFARPGCQLKVETFAPKASYRLNTRNASVVAPGVEHDAQSMSSIYDTFTIYPSVAFLARVEREMNVKPGIFARKVSAGTLLARSSWLDQLVEQYFVRRVLSAACSRSDVAPLEKELCREIITLVVKPSGSRAVPEVQSAVGPVQRILNIIEAELFQEISLESLGKRAGLSVSSLLRVFREDLKTTPYAYIRKRRLEEAKNLLADTDKAIGEIAMLVGFNNQGAFGDAFRAVYGKTPSKFRRT